MDLKTSGKDLSTPPTHTGELDLFYLITIQSKNVPYK